MNVLELYSNFLPSRGGVQRHMYDLCRCLIKRGHKPIVSAWIPSKPSFEIVDEIVVDRFEMPLFLYFVRYLGILYLSFRIICLARRYDVDVIHAHSYTLGIASALAGTVLHRPVVVTFHLSGLGIAWLPAFMSPVEQILKRFFICSTAVIICVSKYIHKETLKLGFPRSKLKVMYNWLPQFPRCNVSGLDRVLQKFNLGGKHFILSVGRLVDSHKGFSLLIRSLRRLIDKKYELDLAIVGTGPDREALRKCSVKLGVGNHVHLLGSVSNSDLACLYRKCDVFVLPSRFEGFGLTLLEAMSFGKPVVATNVGGIPEVVEDGRSGLLVDPDSDAIASGVEKLLSAPNLRNVFAKRSEKVLRKFSKRNCFATVKLIETVVGRG